MLLGFIVARAPPLPERFALMLSQMGIVEEIQFNPPACGMRASRRPKRIPMARALLVGEVHDENAAALGGIAGHADCSGRRPRRDPTRGI
jgi:hypothetical protein